MWLLKGILSGLLLLVFFTVFYLKAFIGPTRAGVAIGMSVIKTGLQMPIYWIALAATIVTSCLWAKALHFAFLERR